MNRKQLHYVLMLLGVIMGSNQGLVHAGPSQDQTLHDAATNSKNPLGDNTSIKDGVKMFESRFGKKILLPAYTAFTPTHTGSSYLEKSGYIRISYFNKLSGQILILEEWIETPRSDFNRSGSFHSITLDNGIKAVYTENEIAKRIWFKKDGMVYYVGLQIDKVPVKLKDLLKVVNSLS